MGVEITPVVVRVAHSLFAFPEVSFPNFSLCDEKRFPFSGLRQLLSPGWENATLSAKTRFLLKSGKVLIRVHSFE